MMRVLILCPIFFLASLASAQMPVRALIAVGTELRPEKDSNNNYVHRTLDNFAMGAGFREYLFILERSTFQDSGGNTTLSVSRRFEDTLLWGFWRGEAWSRISPFLGAGIGTYRETVNTEFMGSSSQDQSSHLFLSGAAFGFSAELPVLWLSLEGRVLFGDQLDLQPSLGGLVRVGFYF